MDALTSADGFGFDADAFSMRLANECKTRGIASRAQFIAVWNGATQAAQINFLARMVFGSTRFPEDAGLTSAQLATLGVP